MNLESLARMNHSSRKFSEASVSSTCEGDTSSESCMLEYMDDKQLCAPAEWSSVSTNEKIADGDDESYLAPSDMPSTREPSPEPLWHMASQYDWTQDYRAGNSGFQVAAHGPHFPGYGQDFAAPPRCAPAPKPADMQRADQGLHAQPLVLLVPKAVPVESRAYSAVLTPMNTGIPAMPFVATPTPPAAEMCVTQPNSCRSYPMPRAPSPMQESGRTLKKKKQTTAETHSNKNGDKDKSHGDIKGECATAPEQNGASKQGGKAKSHHGDDQGDCLFNKLSAQQKEALCKYIYDFMVQKEFTSPEGYLVMDVLSELCKDMCKSDLRGWRTVQYRFDDLICSAPQYFQVFRKVIRATGLYRNRNGVKMVRLIV